MSQLKENSGFLKWFMFALSVNYLRHIKAFRNFLELILYVISNHDFVCWNDIFRTEFEKKRGYIYPNRNLLIGSISSEKH